MVLDYRVLSEQHIQNIDNHKYILVGEHHTDAAVNDVVKDLIDAGTISALYLEAFSEGEYESLNDAKPHAKTAYKMRGNKYDDLVNYALEKNIRVCGLDQEWNLLRDERINRWADYLLEDNCQEQALILIGHSHLIADSDNCHDSKGLTYHLKEKGVSEKELFHISTCYDEHVEPGVYTQENRPDSEFAQRLDNIADMIVFRDKKAESSSNLYIESFAESLVGYGN